MMSENGWPGEPGVPLNPERDGWHWVGGIPYWWRVFDDDDAPLWQVNHLYFTAEEWSYKKYGGPVLTPAEVEARVKEAVDLGIDIATRELDPQIAMLIPWQTAIEDALSNWCDAVADDETPKDALRHLIQIEMDAALDPKVSQAAADLVAKAKRDALEEAARWHDEQAKRWQNTYVKESLSDLDMQAARVMCLEHGGFHIESAAAIRALGEKE